MSIFAIHPIILISVLGLAFAVVAGIFLCGRRSAGERIVLGLLLVVLVVPLGMVVVMVNPWLVDARFRTYRAFYQDIQVGMTREQVLALVSRHYPDGGARGVPKIMDDTPTRLGFFMNPETEREPNWEGIFLSLWNDRVRTIGYSRD